jgi:hypothetical protein
MKAAIIGLPQSGKTTVFTAATGQVVPPHEAPRERIGVVPVPEPRLAVLAQMYKPKKVTAATFELVDIPGFHLDDAHGRDAFRKHLPVVRQSDLLIAVIRSFDNPSVPAYRDRVDPAADLNELWSELLFADLEASTTRVERLEKSLKKPSKTHDQEKRELELMIRCRDELENEKPLSGVITTAEDARLVSSFGFLTEKPILVVYNVSEDRAAAAAPECPSQATAAFSLCAASEAEIAQLEPNDRPAFLADLGLEAPASDRLIQTCFNALGLVVFLTVGEDECRAWPIAKGTHAVDAAGKIHSDLARGFIRAETVAYDDLIAAGDIRGAKAVGKVRQEGKTYEVKDGDILNIKFNL